MPFQYRPRQNRYVGSIADLMGRGRDAEAQALITAANAQAQAAQASGQAWGGAVQGIGNTIAAIPGQLQAQQDRARVVEQRELADADRANRERASAMFAERISPKRVEGQPVEGPNSMPPVPTQHPYQVKQDGAWLFDIEGFQRAAAEAGPGVLEQVGPYINQMSSMNQWRQGVIESGKQEAQRQAVFLSLLDDDELLRVLPVAMRGLEGVFDEAVADGLMGLVRNGDAVGVRKVLNGFTGRQSDRVTVRSGGVVRDFSTGETFEGPPAAQPPLTADQANRLEHRRAVEEGRTTASYNRWLAEEKRLPAEPPRPTEGERNRLEHRRAVEEGRTTASYNRWLTEQRTLPESPDTTPPVPLITDDQGVVDVPASMTGLGLTPAPHEDKLWDRADMTTTGLGSIPVRLLGPVTGAGEQSMANMSAIDIVKEMATRSLAENPRLAVAERRAIRESIDIGTGILESPDKVRIKFRELETVLRRALQRKELIDDIGAILQTIDILGVPAETDWWGRTVQPSPDTAEFDNNGNLIPR